ncbi:hypothetical protein Lal_00045786 [Lupinus albus]|uniref:protein-serine/threonine phosphatase n=1 Tax=Lupinus albus TaxID=3870 RepID=A0A6A5NSF4_LUPAL|nr:putative protein-serine/threonine phosphatase [Lupinus albus]KAF1886553.1 hypothetical protein Lal_00045786 [Lupinus albus]
MGCCVSTRSGSSTYSSGSNGDIVSPSCLEIGFCGQKRARRTFSDNVISLHQLPWLPNKIVTNGKSRSSCIFTQQGQKGVNQDAMIVWEDFMSEDVIFCGVFDGHGPRGHLVARRVRDALPLKLISSLHSCKSRRKRSGKAGFKGNIEPENRESEKDISAEDDLNSTWREAFLKAYKAMDKELKSHPNLNCFCSGSTAVTIVKQGSELFIGSIGDSRAIMGSKDSNDSMLAIQLTVDLKPDLPREAERIKQYKGRVFALQDEPEVLRVWLPFDNAPGLAMARAFGDFCLKKYGVISVPEFYHHALTDRDQFVVIASDGVWDVLSNEEVVEIVSSAPNRSSAARIVVASAAREWKLKYPTSKMDDCAVVCLFFDGKMDLESDCDEQCFSSATIQSNHFGDQIESDDGQKSEPSLPRNYTVRSSVENETNRELSVDVEDGISSVENQNWLSLEGITRVNSLVQLPRFCDEKGPNALS